MATDNKYLVLGLCTGIVVFMLSLFVGIIEEGLIEGLFIASMFGIIFFCMGFLLYGVDYFSNIKFASRGNQE